MITVSQFKTQLQKLVKDDTHTIAVALSGGVDSMCLVYLLSQFKKIYNPKLNIVAITIDHKYRPESTQEAQSISSLVQPWDVNHVIRTLKYTDEELHAIGSQRNFEKIARFKRYSYLKDVCREHEITNLLVGHTLDDQLETYIQRLSMNSSVFGLKGILPISILPIDAEGPFKFYPPIFAIRPLLSFYKSELIETCVQNKIKWFEDYTNKDLTMAKRNTVRDFIFQVPSQIGELNEELQTVSDTTRQAKIESKLANLQLFTKESLAKSIDAATEIADYIDNQANRIQEQIRKAGYVKVEPCSASMRIKLPVELFYQNSVAVMSRMLFRSIYSFSSVTKFHFKYLKMEEIVPKIVDAISKGKGAKLTGFNLNWSIITRDGFVYIYLNRQNPIESHTIKMQVTDIWSEWVLYDGRIWLRFKSRKPINITISAYDTSRKSVLATFAKKVPKFNQLNNMPMVLNEVGDLLGMPTFRLMRASIEAEFYLKDNIFFYN